MTPLQVEQRLVAHYLRTDGPCGAGALRFIDASAAELQEALGIVEVSPTGVFDVLAAGCGGESQIADVLANGWNRSWPDRETPGFFRYLVLTCAVVAAADDNRETQDFGRNLQIRLGSSRTFDRTGIPALWRRLKTWCNQHHRIGWPVREVDLPKGKPSEVHIGVTNAVTFPNWRDIRHLRSELERRPALANSLRAPVDAAVRLCGEVTSEGRYSKWMIEASKEYESLYYSSAKLLHLHRFWAVVCRALNRTRPRRVASSVKLRIELLWGVIVADTRLRLSLVDQEGSEVAVAAFPFEVAVGANTDSVFPKNTPHESALTKWRALFRSGSVPFVQERIGEWLASTRSPSRNESWVYLLDTSRFRQLIDLGICPVRRLSDAWSLLGPTDQAGAQRIHRQLGLDTDAQLELTASFELLSGVTTTRGYLGRPSLLPRIRREGAGVVTVTPADSTQVSATLVNVSERELRLKSDEPLDGLYRVRLEEKSPGGQALALELRARFTPDAPEHPEIKQGDDVRWLRIPEAAERYWVSQRAASITRMDESPAIGTVDERDRLDDLLELIYARGRAGWSEGDLVEEVRVVFPGPSPWDVLRCLEESTWLTRTISTTWRATRYWLNPPRLVVTGAGFGSRVLLLGSASKAVRRRFVATVTTLRGQPQSFLGLGPCSPQLLTALDVSPELLADELGWQLQDLPVAGRAAGPTCWPNEAVDVGKHQLVARWNWSVGRFTSDLEKDAPHQAGVSRWRRTEGDRPDLFSVDVRGRRVLVTRSRTVAIAEGYRLIRRPMFRTADQVLLRNASEGHLPLPLARWLMSAALCNPGPVYMQDRWTYAYPNVEVGVSLIRRWMGTTFVAKSTTGANHAPSQIDSNVYALARHRPGLRPGRGVW
jgi:hypothetical protein